MSLYFTSNMLSKAQNFYRSMLNWLEEALNLVDYMQFREHS